MSEAKPGYERIEGVQVGQYVSYRFFKVDPAWRRLPVEEREAGKEAFAEVVEEWAGRMEGLRAYNVSGIRPEADFFLWQITERYDDLLELGAALNGTPLAGWLTTPYSYLATTKPSVYTDKKRVRQGKVIPREAPYLVVYPFVKKRPWYFLTFEERADAMRQHAEVGGKFVTVTNHTTYSFGIDDQEFMPAFECEEPADFMHLMMTLRETEASRWTERDTPIFVGASRPIRAVLAALDGAAVHAAARLREARSAVGVLGAPGARRSPRHSSASTTKNAIASAPVGERPIAAPMSTHREDDRAVEHAPRALRPRLEVAAPLAPDEEEEERDREEERDPEQPAGRRRAPARARGRRRRARSGRRSRARARSGSRRSASRSRHGATNAERGGDERRDGEPEQPPARVGRRVEPRRQDDAERDRAVDVVQLVGGAVVAREQQKPERRLRDEQRLRQRQEVDRGAAQQRRRAGRRRGRRRPRAGSRR